MTKISLALILSILFPSIYTFAQTPDSETPAVENICDGLFGAEYGLCNAYCEALDCDTDLGYEKHSKACDKVLRNFMKKSGGIEPPCLDACGGVCEEPFICVDGQCCIEEGAECVEITDSGLCNENNCLDPFFCESRSFCCPPDPLPFCLDP